MYTGNCNCVAEANIFNDPTAAKIVFNSKWNSCVIAPLNVTHSIYIDTPFLAELNDIPIVGPPIFNSHKHYINALVEKFGYVIETIPCHDPVPVVYFLEPEIFVTKTGFVDVETEGKLTVGMTLIDTMGFLKNDVNYENKSIVLTSCDQNAFKKKCVDVIKERMFEILDKEL